MAMDFSKLLQQIETVTTKKTYTDNSSEYWKPTKDKAGNAAAVIRFLPNKDVEDIPFVRMFSHSFKHKVTGHWYIENSLSTINGQDYIGTVNQGLWNSGLEEDKELCRIQKRKLQYISNILVIKDLGNPENNGKVFKYKYGAKIFGKIHSAAKGDADLGEAAVNAFDTELGADFLLKMQKANDQFNYDASKFNNARALFDGDEDKINAVLAQCADLNMEISPDKFKTEAELKDKYLWVTGAKKSGVAAPKAQDQSVDDELLMLAKMANEEPKAPPKPAKKGPPMPVMTSEDDGDDTDFFASLVAD
jgi:hypothetical protein